MENAQPPLLNAPVPPVAAVRALRRSHAVTFKLLFIAALVLLLELPLGLINDLRQERAGNREEANTRLAAERVARREPVYSPTVAAAEGYRMVERSLKHSMLVLTLVFTAFFLFETLAGLKLHAVHYGLVGAAMCLFYLALLALGEWMTPGWAYVCAAVASSLLVTLYSISVLRSYGRASLIAVLLTVEHGILFVVLRMEDYALLTGTAVLFIALGGLMYFTRHVDWFAQGGGKEARA